MRIEAGAAVAGDVMKCRLKHVDSRDYAVAFTAAQIDRLHAIFPSGVCDWSRRGVKQKPISGVWLDYSQRRGEDDDQGDED